MRFNKRSWSRLTASPLIQIALLTRSWIPRHAFPHESSHSQKAIPAPSGRLRPPTKIAAPSSKTFSFESKLTSKPATSVSQSTSTTVGTKRKAVTSTNAPAPTTRTRTTKVASAVVAPKKPALKPRNETQPPPATTNAKTEDSEEPPKKKKRAAWDVKGRLQDLEEYHQQTESRLHGSTERVSSLNAQLTESQTTSKYEK